MINTASSSAEQVKTAVNINFADYKQELQTFLRLSENQQTLVDVVASDLTAAGSILNQDPNLIDDIADTNGVDRKRLKMAYDIIKAKSAGPELSNTMSADIEGNTEPEVDAKAPETPEQKIARLTAELKAKDNRLKTIEPAVIAAELVTHPTKLPRFLRQKMRNRMIARKPRDPYALLYYMRDGQLRRFRKTKNRMKNIDNVYRDLKAKYGPDAQANEKFIHQKRIMEKRRAVIEQAYKAVQGVKPMKVSL